MKWRENKRQNNDDIQWESVFFYLVVDQTNSIDTGGVISICSASDDLPVNKNNDDTNMLRSLDSLFDCFECHSIFVIVDPFEKFPDARESHFSLVQVPFYSTTISVDPIYKNIDTRVSPFYLVHAPPRSTIDSFEQYHRPSSICQTHVYYFWCQMVYYYCTTIPE